MADGLFAGNGVFHVLPKLDITPLRELFRAAVPRMLQKKGRIDDTLIQNLLTWRHTSGFSVHQGHQLARGDADGQEALAQYIIRNTFSVEKIRYQQETGAVIYTSKMTHGPNRNNFKILNSREFIAAITQHIPEKSFQLVRHYG